MELLDGKFASQKVIDTLKLETSKLISQNKRVPHLVAILIGDNAASQVYVKSKVNSCNEIGFHSTLITKDSSCSEKELLDMITHYAQDKNIDGILVQLPLPNHINATKIIESIPPEKDVDGFHSINIGKICLGMDGFISATPLGIILLLEEYKISVASKNIVIVGRSHIVGRPLSILLSSSHPNYGNGTVTLCHSKTKNLSSFTRQADILIACIGKPYFIKQDMVQKDAVVIDVGINRIEIEGKKKLVGDVDFDKVAPLCSYITPVPGGVGKMTIAALMKNTFLAYNLKK